MMRKLTQFFSTYSHPLQFLCFAIFHKRGMAFLVKSALILLKQQGNNSKAHMLLFTVILEVLADAIK